MAARWSQPKVTDKLPSSVLQHFLPRFYLKRFLDGSNPGRGTPFLWIQKSGTGEWRKRWLKHLAAEKNFYTVTAASGEPDQQIERLLGRAETRMASTLRSKIDQGRPLTDRDRACVATFIMLLLARVPATIERVGGFIERQTVSLVRGLHKMAMADPAALEELKRKAPSEIFREALGNLGADDMVHGNCRVDAPRDLVVQTVVSAALKQAELIFDMAWTFLRTDPPDFFITSDNPVFITNPSSEPLSLESRSPLMELSVPLGRQCALLACFTSHREVQYRSVESSIHVREINERTTRLAKRCLIAGQPLDYPYAARWTM